MKSMVDNTLAMSRLDAGMRVMHSEEVDIAAAAGEAMSMIFSHSSGDRQPALMLELDIAAIDEGPGIAPSCTLRTDRQALAQILRNRLPLASRLSMQSTKSVLSE